MNKPIALTLALLWIAAASHLIAAEEHGGKEHGGN